MTQDPTPTGGAMSNTVEAGSATVIIGALFDLLPKAAALLGVLWYVVQLWESQTCHNIRATLCRWFNRLRAAQWRQP